MKTFVSKKSIDYEKLKKYLEPAHNTNQFSNWGWAVSELERRAHKMLQIDDSKAVIATCSGAAALHAIIFAIQRNIDTNLRIATQDFTFPAASQGPATGPIIVDFDKSLNFNVRDEYAHGYAKIYIVTNCFGHLQNLEYILDYAQSEDKIVIFDNAATPYSFYQGTNSCNLGNASFISLHHTKPLGFGEGGLAIVDKEFEEHVRIACNFGFIDRQFNERGSNFKMSEIAASAVLQYWDTFDLEELTDKLLDSYYDSLFHLNHNNLGDIFPNYSDESKFLPSCLPYVYENAKSITDIEDPEAKKYYVPLRGMPVSTEIFNRIICHPIMENTIE